MEPFRLLPGRGVCAISKFIYTYGLCWGLDESGYKGRWCYETKQDALDALRLWDGIDDPSGPWVKYKGIDGERFNTNL